MKCKHCGGTGELPNPAALRQKRKSAGLLLREVAKKLKISPTYLGDIERGARNCPPRVRRFYETKL